MRIVSIHIIFWGIRRKKSCARLRFSEIWCTETSTKIANFVEIRRRKAPERFSCALTTRNHDDSLRIVVSFRLVMKKSIQIQSWSSTGTKYFLPRNWWFSWKFWKSADAAKMRSPTNLWYFLSWHNSCIERFLLNADTSDPFWRCCSFFRKDKIKKHEYVEDSRGCPLASGYLGYFLAWMEENNY